MCAILLMERIVERDLTECESCSEMINFLEIERGETRNDRKVFLGKTLEWARQVPQSK